VVTTVDLAWDASAAPEKIRDWYRNSDPVLAFIRKIVKEGAATRGQLAELDAGVIKEIEEAVQFALASPFPDPQEALTDVFA
jgi:acetoin:2,6-dichlorophenolindophenol oxidoreductase subunit alpha